MSSKSPYYITTAIAYVNGAPHLGHAYEVILTDVMARFRRLDGHQVFFLTGTDEHGEKVATTAERNNMAPRDFCDKIAAQFVEMDEILNISHDDFIRTTQPRHYAASQAIWNELTKRGDIYLGKYEGWYSVRDEAYFGEDELNTDENGKKVAPSGAEVTWKEEPSYFFRLSAYTEKLLAYYEQHPEFIEPDTRRNEIVSFVRQEGGLKDLSVSRTSFDWGVPVPNDDRHVMYVWLDALTNYITGVGYPDTNSDTFKTFWPADVHVIGKDIIRFHAIYWPAFLMAANLPLPKKIFAHGFINVEGQKMSKSLGNVLSPHDLVNAYGVDQTRYFLMREVPHGQDGNFSHEQAILRLNSDLANSLGNLAQRTLSMIAKNCGEVVPQPDGFTEDDKALLDLAHIRMLPLVRHEYDRFMIHRAIEEIMRVSYEANSYIDRQAPWGLKKTDPQRMNTVLYVLAEVVRCLALIMQPLTPASAARMLEQLAVAENERSFEFISSGHSLKPGVKLPAPQGVFPRMGDAQNQKAAG
ncbi:MAG: methionine--tRNA ligase [Micavibrio aeruginosavorus]|uniref:Methionine--tRNA ligase n=1 Tax=Micavibrio aeruginosavorus TaxID=349221 RepID=A0A7T5R0R4_9BACT|nr:MAG: methionine--tRNA ligase [Micavibrio aeruginosavorus]